MFFLRHQRSRSPLAGLCPAQRNFCVWDGENLPVKFHLHPLAHLGKFAQLEQQNTRREWLNFLRPTTPLNYRWSLYRLPDTILRELARNSMWGLATPPASVRQALHRLWNLQQSGRLTFQELSNLTWPEFHQLELCCRGENYPTSATIPPPPLPSAEAVAEAVERTNSALKHLGIDPRTGQMSAKNL